MKVLGHPIEFNPMYEFLQKDRKKNKVMLGKICNFIKQLEKTDNPIGIHHRLRDIPKPYAKKFGLQVLYHVDMPDYHRLFYTVRRSLSGEKEALLIENMSHNRYNKVFGHYKKKSH